MMRPTICALVLVAAAPVTVQAQYKLVGPDGSVTYTDRPPAGTSAKVTALSRRGATGNPLSTDVELPFDLRQVAGRYPVTLFTSPDCPPCDNGRQMLQQRGIPYVERTVTSEDDAGALERAVGGRSVPSLTVGSQGLRGFSPTDWGAYLDAAGYPRESRLPRGWQPPAAAPLTARAAPPVQRAAAAPPADGDSSNEPPPTVPNVPSIKF